MCMVIDYDKYKTDGWGLSQMALHKLSELIIDLDKDLVRVLEFGSGKSTEFLHDLNEHLDFDLDITSFDNDLEYAYKPKDNDVVNLKIRPLIETSDINYDRMFTNKIYDKSLMTVKTSMLSTRQKNNFYNIFDEDLFGEYDIMILDGPNGNGRNISFLITKNYLKKGSYVLIDDYNHYDFVDKFLSIFDAELIFENSDRNYGGEFLIYKIK